jgi:hypothetical protein
MRLTTQNLFPLPTWAPALQRVPSPLVQLNEAFTKGERAIDRPRGKCCRSKRRQLARLARHLNFGNEISV